MTFHIDGICRGSGFTNAIGAAVNLGDIQTHIELIWPHATPTLRANDIRAQLTALILAYRTALIRSAELAAGGANIVVEIRCDKDELWAFSYTNGQKVENWRRTGWKENGNDVLNRDLIEVAHDLRVSIEQVGRVEFIDLKRDVDNFAYRMCEVEMDKMQQARGIDPYSGVYSE